MFKYNSDERITAQQCLNHPFFKNVSQTLKSLASNQGQAMNRMKRARMPIGTASPTDTIQAAHSSQGHLNADLAPGLVVPTTKVGGHDSPNFGTLDMNTSTKSPQRFSMMDAAQTEKNILNINQVKFQPGAVAQAQSGTQAQNSASSNKVTLNSASGQINEYENADKENKYK